MEYLLIIVILVLLISIINKIKSNHTSLQNNIYDLSKQIESLKKDISNITVKEKIPTTPKEEEPCILILATFVINIKKLFSFLAPLLYVDNLYYDSEIAECALLQ